MLAAVVAAVILANSTRPNVASAQPAVNGGAIPGWTVEISSGKPAVTQVRLTAGAGSTRLTLALTKPVTPEVSTLSDPDRVIIDLPEVDFRIDAAAGQNGKGLVKAFRFGLFRTRQSRIVIDTDGPVHVKKAGVESKSGRGPQLVVELVRARRARQPRSPPAAADASPTPMTALRPTRFEGPPPDVISREGRPVIVIDPGHGGLDPGAVGPGGLLEKDVVLSVARRVRALLAETGRYTVVLTRNRDIYVPLERRVRISRRHKADLFVSLHADAVPEENLANLVRGGSIYTLSEHASNEQARRLAEKENAADVLAGLTQATHDEQDEVRSILIDLLRRETENFSADFSNLLTDELRKHIKLARDPQRSAAFRVLKQAESPSVLIELGYMSNLEDQKLLRSPDWQAKVARAIVRAIDSFFARRAVGAVHAP